MASPAGPTAESGAPYLGKGSAFDRALAAFADAHADQPERDQAAVGAAVNAGRVKTVEEKWRRLSLHSVRAFLS